MAQAQGAEQSSDTNRDLGTLSGLMGKTHVTFNGNFSYAPSPYIESVMEQHYGNLEIKSISITSFGGSTEAANSLLNFVESRVP